MAAEPPIVRPKLQQTQPKGPSCRRCQGSHTGLAHTEPDSRLKEKYVAARQRNNKLAAAIARLLKK